MRTIILLYLTMCFSSVCFSQQPDVVGEGQTAIEEIAKEKKVIEDEFDQKDQELKTSLKRLEQELEQLRSGSDELSIENLSKRIAALEEKQQLVDKRDTAFRIEEIQLLEIRYEAGLLVIKDMIELMKTAKSQYSSLDFQNSYSELSNPNKFSAYGQNLSFLKEKLVKQGLTLPDINLGNVVLNTAYSITQSIVSKKDDKNSKIEELICILDFTSESSANLRIVQYDLEYLIASVDTLSLKFEQLFETYTNVVGYNESFENYITDLNDKLDSDVVPKFFLQLKQQPNNIDKSVLKDLSFGLNMVADAHQEYVGFISQNIAYYKKFNIIMGDLEPRCISSPSLQIVLERKFDESKNKLIRAPSKSLRA